jgi:hypothetical protein
MSEITVAQTDDKFYALVSMAIERGTGVEQLEKLMALNTQWEAAQAKRVYLESKTLFQSALPVIKKLKTAKFPTKSGGTMNYSYASLDDIAESIKPYLQQFGFSYRWDQTFNDGAIRVRCVLTHQGGHSESCEMVGGADASGTKNALQAIASGTTYMRRYTLTGVLGIATADEDIDARLPEEPTESSDLNAILHADEGKDRADAISFKIFEASSMAELKMAGEEISSLPEGPHKENIKQVYLAARAILKNKNNNGE